MSELAPAALETEEGFAAYCKQQSFLEFGPFVRASTYEFLTQGQDLWFREFGRDPRRPVVMRGARERLKGKYRRKSAYAEVVVDRYFKAIKFTAFRPKETDAMRSIVMAHMMKRGHYVNDYERIVMTALCGHREAKFYVDGEWRWGTAEEWRKARRLRAPSIIFKGKRFDLRKFNPSVVLPPVPRVRPSDPIRKSALSLQQQRAAAHLALKEMGIEF